MSYRSSFGVMLIAVRSLLQAVSVSSVDGSVDSAVTVAGISGGIRDGSISAVSVSVGDGTAPGCNWSSVSSGVHVRGRGGGDASHEGDESDLQ